MSKPRRVLSLVRVSGKPQIDRTGIPRQLDTISEIIERENLIIEEGDEYRFEGLSGASVERFPKFRAMLDRLKDPQLAGIVFAEVSRLFRPEFADQLAISKPFRVNGKLVFYEDGVLDLRKDRDIAIFVEEAMKAGAYRKRMLKNTQWGRNERRTRGDCKSDPLLQGVKFVPHPRVRDELVVGHFEYTPESERMPEAYSRVLAGDSYTTTANRLGFYSPSVLRDYLRSRWWIGEKASLKKRINAGLREDGSEYWGYRLKREVPIIVPANGLAHPCQDCKVHFKPLISRPTFEAVQLILDRTEKTWVRNTEARKDSPYIGIGVLTCARCGRKLYSKPNKRTGMLHYRCSSYNNGNTPCGAPHIRQAEIDKELRFYATIRLTDRRFVRKLIPEVPRTNTTLIEHQISLMDKRLDSLYERLGNPRFDQIRIEKNIESTTQQRRDLDEQLTAASKPMKAHVDVDDLVRRFKRFGRLSLEEQRAAIRGTFAKVVVDYDEETAEPSIVRVELRPHSFTTP